MFLSSKTELSYLFVLTTLCNIAYDFGKDLLAPETPYCQLVCVAW